MIRAFVAMLLLAAAADWQVRPWRPSPVSSPAFESHPAFDQARSTIYFVRSSPAFKGWRILQSICRDGQWSKPQPVPFAGAGVEADPFVTRDGRTLFFISSRKDDGVSGRSLDLWRVDRPHPSAPWGKPTRLPEPVNSAGNEWFPRLAQDGWLYFGSDRPGGFGQTDIYRAKEIGGRWIVENLGPGVNGGGDEYEAEISPDGRRMILMADGDLFSVRSTDGKWRDRTRFRSNINSGDLEVGPLFSPSGRSFLFARDLGTRPPPAGGSGELMLATSGKSENWPPRCHWRRRLAVGGRFASNGFRE